MPPDWTQLPEFDIATLNQRRKVSDVPGCERHFHAAEEKVTPNSLIDAPGLVLASCRHGSQIRLFDMLPGLGERRVYAALLANELAKSNKSARLHIMYDIACQFDTYARKIAPDTFQAAKFAVPALHGYAHQFQCQVSYHCRFVKGFGLSDGENVERNWSEMDRLVPPLRTSTSTRRLHALCNFIRSASRRKRMGFGRVLAQRWHAAEKVQTDVQQELKRIFEESLPEDSSANDMESFVTELRADIIDRETFYRQTASVSPGRALDLEPIDLLFQVLTVQRADESTAFANGVPLHVPPDVDSMASTSPTRLDYDELWRRWQSMDTLSDPQSVQVLEDICISNNWLRGVLNYDQGLFEKAFARKLSRQILLLRRKIWTKWSDNMERNRRLRASKTGEYGSSMILKAILKASQALRSLIEEHNKLIAQHIQELPDQPSHSKLELAILNKEVESPGFLLMPATVLRHRWMSTNTRASAMEYLSRLDRAREEFALLKAETLRLFVFYSSRCRTLESALQCSEPESLLLQTTFLETRSFHSIARSINQIPALSCTVNIKLADELIHNLRTRLQSCAIKLTDTSACITSTSNSIRETVPVEDGDTLSDDEIQGEMTVEQAAEEQLIEIIDSFPDLDLNLDGDL